MPRFNLKDITGVIPALITPFNEDESLNEQGMKELVEHLIGKGVNGLYLTGSTGEGFLMTPDERKRVVEIVIGQVAGRIPVMVHVGAIGTGISIDLAKHAEQAGADAVSSVPPFYWKFNDESIFNYYKDITESTSLPMVVYNIPLAGLVGYEQVKKFASIEGVDGIKFTATTHFEIMRMKEEIGKDFMVYSGADEMSISGLSFGADGIIGSFYNLMPEVFIRIFNFMKEGKYREAEEQQKIANALILHCTSGNYVGMMKRALTWMGIDAGYCRRPFINITASEEEDLKKAFCRIKDEYKIKGIDFLETL